MAIRWRDLNSVTEVLDSHPPHSNSCDDAARTLLPHAKEVDGSAYTISVRPKNKERYVVPKGMKNPLWFMHYACSVSEHCVDALTGPPGTTQDKYLTEHWEYPNCLVIAPEDIPDVT